MTFDVVHSFQRKMLEQSRHLSYIKMFTATRATIYTSHVRHICTSDVPRLYFTCTSPILHIYTSDVPRLYFTCTSPILHICTSDVPHLYFTCTSPILHICTSEKEEAEGVFWTDKGKKGQYQNGSPNQLLDYYMNHIIIK